MEAHPGHPQVHASLSVVNDAALIERVETSLVQGLEQFKYPKASVFAVRLAFHEALSNSFRHGHRSLPSSTPVNVEFHVTSRHVTIDIEDQGPGFDPASIPDPTAEENLERGSGRGLLLIRAYMAQVEYNPRGNRLRMVYDRPPDA